MARFLRAMLGRLAAFRDAQSGHVAVIFALTLIPVIGLTGAAIDYTRATSVRSAMQAALDATALAMSREATTLSATALNEKAAAYFAAAFNRPEVQGISVSASYSSVNGSTVSITGTGQIATAFMGIVGVDQIPFSSSSKTVWGTGKIRVALVLDVSGSMADGGRMTALKTATKDMLTTFQNAATNPGDIQVAIVPFNKNVNAGAGNHAASWLTWTDWENRNGTCTGYENYDGWGSPRTKNSCLDHEGTWTPAAHTNWDGCVMDRNQDHDVLNTTPAPSTVATLFPAQQYPGNCPESVMGLSYNWTELKNKVDALAPLGNTNQPIGLAWGWMALTQNEPLFAPALPADVTTDHFIVLLSDGENTQDRWYSGWGAESQINARQTKICDNIKAAGIQIYSVLLIDGNEDLMRSCASKPDMFFKLTSANQVIAAFSTIGVKLAKLRLTQ